MRRGEKRRMYWEFSMGVYTGKLCLFHIFAYDWFSGGGGVEG